MEEPNLTCHWFKSPSIMNPICLPHHCILMDGTIQTIIQTMWSYILPFREDC